MICMVNSIIYLMPMYLYKFLYICGIDVKRVIKIVNLSFIFLYCWWLSHGTADLLCISYFGSMYVFQLYGLWSSDSSLCQY